MALGYNTLSVIAGASGNPNLVKPQPGEVNGFYFYNSAAYAVWLKFYNSATIPTAGAGTPKLRYGLPAGAAGTITLGGSENESAPFDAGIGFTIVKGQADNDATNLVAGDVVVNVYWK